MDLETCRSEASILLSAQLTEGRHGQSECDRSSWLPMEAVCSHAVHEVVAA